MLSFHAFSDALLAQQPLTGRIYGTDLLGVLRKLVVKAVVAPFELVASQSAEVFTYRPNRSEPFPGSADGGAVSSSVPVI